MSLSVIIPALNEAGVLPGLLGDLRGLGDLVTEIIVADAASADGTTEVARAFGASVVSAARGRSHQLNAGAHLATGSWLLFLHADSRMGADAIAEIRRVLSEPGVIKAAVFRFAIDLPTPWRTVLEGGQAIREALFGLSYGDQGLLVQRPAFDAVGGFPDIPLMEDVVIIRRLRRHVGVVRLAAPLLTSGRRYRDRGILRTWLQHAMMISLYTIGVSPARLARWRDGSVAHAP